MIKIMLVSSVFLYNTGLQVNGDIEGIYEGNAAKFFSSSPWHTTLAIQNESTNSQFTFAVGGNENNELLPANLGIFNGSKKRTKLALMVDAKTNNIGMGFNTTVAKPAVSTLTIHKGDINIEAIGSGII